MDLILWQHESFTKPNHLLKKRNFILLEFINFLRVILNIYSLTQEIHIIFCLDTMYKLIR